MSVLPTVLIKTEGGPVTINESDFDSEKHDLFEVSEEGKEVDVETVAQQKSRLYEQLIDSGYEGLLTSTSSIKKLQKEIDSLS